MNKKLGECPGANEIKKRRKTGKTAPECDDGAVKPDSKYLESNAAREDTVRGGGWQGLFAAIASARAENKRIKNPGRACIFPKTV